MYLCTKELAVRKKMLHKVPTLCCFSRHNVVYRVVDRNVYRT